jgi:hypothetical protein
MADLRYPIGKFEWIPPEGEEQMARRRAHTPTCWPSYRPT